MKVFVLIQFEPGSTRMRDVLGVFDSKQAAEFARNQERHKAAMKDVHYGAQDFEISEQEIQS